MVNAMHSPSISDDEYDDTLVKVDVDDDDDEAHEQQR